MWKSESQRRIRNSEERDDLCDELSKTGVICVTWIRHHYLCTSFYHRLHARTTHGFNRVYQVCSVRSQAYCPTVTSILSHLVTTIIRSSSVGYLRYAFDNIGRCAVACLHKLWMLVVRLYVAITGCVCRQLGEAGTLSKKMCGMESSNESISEVRIYWARIDQDIWRLRERLQCPISSMFRWRMNYFRCSPRSGFYAILVFVAFTFVLMTYLYSGSSVNRINLHKNENPQGAPQQPHGDKSFRHFEHKNRPDRQRDRSWNRHKNHHKKKEHPVEEEWQQLSTPKMKQVLDVINLMSRLKSSNETSTVVVQKQILRRQIKLLRDAMTSQHTMLSKPSRTPACVGNLRPGEVEDLLCIPRPKFLRHIKNPCWYSDSTSNGTDRTLHCLPYFHILGCAKSGTTDLWNRLMSHPHTVSNDGLLHKEALWWSWYRYGISGYKRQMRVQDFSDYVNLFQDTARQIQSSIDKETLFHQILITGDASPPDFWDFRGWANISQNRHHDVPTVITPHLMKHIYADPKFIIMFRDPIDRLYSDYFFVGLGLTAEDFHNDILTSVDMLAKCVEQQGLQHCFHDHDLYVKLPVRLPFACYSVFMREWLQVFPLRNFLFIKTEEYEKNSEDTLKSVMDFLGLGPLKDSQLQVITEEERARVTVQKQIAGPMKNATRIILEELLDAGCKIAGSNSVCDFRWQCPVLKC